jgi:hypothetical protein
MGEIGWFQLLTAALGGGFVVKALDILYQEILRRIERSRSAKQFVDDHLDPILKAADELVGKLRSLAENDFQEIRGSSADLAKPSSPNFGSVLFLFALFWARIEIYRREGMSVATSNDQRGRRLNSFLDCLESRGARLVDRITQRAIGESMLAGDRSTKDYIKFVQTLEDDERSRRWLDPVAVVLTRTHHTSERQKLLQYGAIVHAMVDTLDPNHLVTRERPSYPNKLSRRSWRDLKYRVFGRYLPFVDSHKYLGPSKADGVPKNVKATRKTFPPPRGALRLLGAPLFRWGRQARVK